MVIEPGINEKLLAYAYSYRILNLMPKNILDS